MNQTRLLFILAFSVKVFAIYEPLELYQSTLEIVSTEEGTINFWALEVIDLRESSLLLYLCRISWAQDRLALNHKDPCSTSPVSQRLSLSSGL